MNESGKVIYHTLFLGIILLISGWFKDIAPYGTALPVHSALFLPLWISCPITGEQTLTGIPTLPSSTDNTKK